MVAASRGGGARMVDCRISKMARRSNKRECCKHLTAQDSVWRTSEEMMMIKVVSFSNRLINTKLMMISLTAIGFASAIRKRQSGYYRLRLAAASGVCPGCGAIAYQNCWPARCKFLWSTGTAHPAGIGEVKRLCYSTARGRTQINEDGLALRRRH